MGRDRGNFTGRMQAENGLNREDSDIDSLYRAHS